jgi:hypothetical protein
VLDRGHDLFPEPKWGLDRGFYEQRRGRLELDQLGPAVGAPLQMPLELLRFVGGQGVQS